DDVPLPEAPLRLRRQDAEVRAAAVGEERGRGAAGRFVLARSLRRRGGYGREDDEALEYRIHFPTFDRDSPMYYGSHRPALYDAMFLCSLRALRLALAPSTEL
ncbi:hypothetical protein THAOC_08723, partial [Thalassiosira oceanica]